MKQLPVLPPRPAVSGSTRMAGHHLTLRAALHHRPILRALAVLAALALAVGCAQTPPQTENPKAASDDEVPGPEPTVQVGKGDLPGIDEICGNGIDDDGNGQADCSDSACSWRWTCLPACQAFDGCRVERGCGCTWGQDCPAMGSAEHDSCAAKCDEDDSCRRGCMDALEEPDQDLLLDAYTCLADNCQPNEYDLCKDTLCSVPWSECSTSGTWNCEGFDECIGQCQGAEDPELCQMSCQQFVSAEGLQDYHAWKPCIDAFCNPDGDPWPTGKTCLWLAKYSACQDIGNSCSSHFPFQGALSCRNFFGCVDMCASDFGQDDDGLAQCVVNCELDTYYGELLKAADGVSCLLEQCAGPDGEIAASCLSHAINGVCNPFVNSCKDVVVIIP